MLATMATWGTGFSNHFSFSWQLVQEGGTEKIWHQHSYFQSFSLPSSLRTISNQLCVKPNVNRVQSVQHHLRDSVLVGGRYEPYVPAKTCSDMICLQVCCQPSPTRASSANRCSNYAEKGYSCVPKTSCRFNLSQKNQSNLFAMTQLSYTTILLKGWWKGFDFKE